MSGKGQPDFTRLRKRADFYLVRHGESVANRDQLIQGRQNAPLSEKGRTHARAAGAWFSGKRIDAVYCSPLDRAAETAQIICATAGYPAPIPDARIIELDTGLFSGLGYEEIRVRFPAEWNRFQAESWEAVPEAERVASLRARAFDYWGHLIDMANQGKRSVVTVSHAGMIQWLIKATLGSTRWMPLFAASNCGIFHFAAQPVRGGQSRGGKSRGTSAEVLPLPGVQSARESSVETLLSGEPDLTGEGDGDSPVVGCFGEWRLMNFVPY